MAYPKLVQIYEFFMIMIASVLIEAEIIIQTIPMIMIMQLQLVTQNITDGRNGYLQIYIKMV